MPVHSEFRQPSTSSSSANSSSRSTGALTRLLQPHLERVAVDAPVVGIEAVVVDLDLAQLVARHDPERRRLLPPRVELARVRLREALVRCLEGARVLERLALALAPEALVDHAAPASTARRTPSVCSSESRRSSSRSLLRGPFPVTT